MSIETLHILEGFDLKGMGHNSADYLHTVLEALKLVFADRHYYYGDPDFVGVPLDGLLSKDYAKARGAAIDPRQASPGMPDPGDPWPFQGGVRPSKGAARPEPVAGRLEADTSYACVLDRWGNAFSATPSERLGNPPLPAPLTAASPVRVRPRWG